MTRQTTVRRINEWCWPLTGNGKPDSECFELPAFLEGAVAHSQSGQAYPPLKPGYYKIIEPAFNYMVLGDYPAQASNQLISREWITADTYASLYGDGAPAASAGVMGLDWGEFGSDANAACFRYGGYVERIVTWQGVDTIATSERTVVEFKARKAITGVNVDATGVGAGVAPYVQRQGIPAHRVMAASSPTRKTEIGEFALLRDQLWWLCREWLRTDPGAMLPPDEMLIEELTVPTYEVYNGKIKVMKKDTMRELLKRSPDRADALCLTFYEPPLLFPQFADRK